jgi:hypothetical protein
MTNEDVAPPSPAFLTTDLRQHLSKIRAALEIEKDAEYMIAQGYQLDFDRRLQLLLVNVLLTDAQLRNPDQSN